MEFRILGPLEVWDGDRLVPVNAAKQRAVLALLLLNVDRVVAVERLIDELWGERPPTRPRSTLHAHVHRLRRALRRADRSGAAMLDTRPAGYLIRVPPGDLDRHRWDRLVAEGRAALTDGHRTLAVARLRAALTLWRGPALADVPTPAVRAEAHGLDERRWEVLEQCLAAELALGRHAAVLPELETLVAAHPYREELCAKLMVALSGVGRRAEALDAFTRARNRLAGDLGVEPGSELRGLHRTILRGEPDRPEPAVAPLRPGPDVPPAQLPADVYGFTGRTEELARLDGILAAADGPPKAVAVAVLSGTAGVGKTTLAVHWAHRVAARFPDGQLYVNLRGYDAEAQTDPADALVGFLGALAVPPDRVASGLDARAAMYRSLLAGRRMLVLLDNARDVDQVRPLLPGAPGALVLVTSRDRLSGLTVAVGARILPVDLLDGAAARELLAGRIDPARVAAEPRAVDGIVAGCAGLPLALTVVAARAVAQPTFPLAGLADELREARGTLRAVADGAGIGDVRTVFSWSYRTLSPPAARLFRLLGLHPGPDVAAPAAASLVDLPVSGVRPLLAELNRAHLVDEHLPGRHTFHDLLRAYARELADAVDPQSDRRAAVHRLLDHYLHSAHAADRLLRPHQRGLPLAPAASGAVPENFAEQRSALAWFDRERAVLVGMVGAAAGAGFHPQVWQLAWALTEFFDRQGHWHDWTRTQHEALAAARQLSDPLAQAHAERELGRAYAQLGSLADAERRLGRALELFERAGERTYQAYTRHSLGAVLDRQGRYREALDQARRVLELTEDAADRAGQANARSAVGWYQMRLGGYAEAIGECRRALVIQQELGDRRAEASTWSHLGTAHHHLGQHSQAARCFHQALDLYQDLGDRFYPAELLVAVGDNQAAADDPEGARAAWQRAVEMLDALGHPRADEVRSRLRPLLDQPDPG